MSVGMIFSSIALGVSLIVSAVKLFYWLVTADPRSVVLMGRRVLWVLAATSVPSLILLLVYEQWTAAMLTAAAVIAIPAILNWRMLILRQKLKMSWNHAVAPDELRGDFGQPPPDPELVRRAAIVLEDYLIHAGHPEISARIDGRSVDQGAPAPSEEPMDAEEALQVLGLHPGAKATEIRAAHRRLVQLVHPDRGGTNYLAAKINRAKDVLLPAAPKRTRTANSAPKNS